MASVLSIPCACVIISIYIYVYAHISMFFLRSLLCSVLVQRIIMMLNAPLLVFVKLKDQGETGRLVLVEV